jgi:hypothetical protein
MENKNELQRNQDPKKKAGLGGGETGQTLGGDGEQDRDYQRAGEWVDNPKAASGTQVDMQEGGNDKTGPSWGPEFTAQDHDGDSVVKDVENQGDQEAVAIRAAQKADCDNDQRGGEKRNLKQLTGN